MSAGLAPTPLVPSGLAQGALLNLETFQPVGAFKVRGALALAGKVEAAGRLVVVVSGRDIAAAACSAAIGGT